MLAATLFSAAAFLAVYLFSDDVISPLDGGEKGINGRVTTSDDTGALVQSFNASSDLDFAGMCPIHVYL